MKHKKKSSVIDLTYNIKEAALYFDNIIPLHCEIAPTSKLSYLDILGTILPTQMYRKKNDGTVCIAHELESVLVNYVEWQNAYYDKKDSQIIEEKFYAYLMQMSPLTRKFNLGNVPKLILPNCLNNKIENSDDFLVTMSNLSLIDVSNSSWDKIVEFRKDPVSIKKLRRLKRVFEDTYIDKDRAYIEDDIQLRLEEYDNTVRDWGFETKTSCLSMLFSSKSLAATTAGTIGSAILGTPTIAAATAISGAVIEIGKISIYVAKQKYEHDKILRDHSLSYMISAKEALGKLT